ncbi:ankyrin repeat domain-containing protein [Xanthomonas campestris]|uniref:ankyrin repeat domain-containing protein n=1 Tax=Xanthomonas campestris TaxID=339 RepID=UPI0011106BC5|nr:ankyrin repeat domain-containing protein [Xanthomonas campestris]MBD8246553.1 ankyrin repeat domain-containing protein [Xanthomonas campestris]QCX68034.1 hypothetical protein DFG55_17890 [Xanthomonas campestris pv. campestris]QCX71469.1 hypothetical protein DFG54_12535 [Xanthomonas campestris pv. campestris]
MKATKEHWRCIHHDEINLPGNKTLSWHFHLHWFREEHKPFYCIDRNIFKTTLDAVREHDLSALHTRLKYLHQTVCCNNALTEACKLGFLDGVKALLERASSHWSVKEALYVAASNGHTRVVLYLLREKAAEIIDPRPHEFYKVAKVACNETAKAMVRFAVFKWEDRLRFLPLWLIITCKIGCVHLTKSLLKKIIDFDTNIPLCSALDGDHWECASLIWTRVSENHRETIKKMAKERSDQRISQMEAWVEMKALQQEIIVKKFPVKAGRRV